MLSGFLNASSWSSWNILTFGGFRWTLIVSRTPSKTFEKVKQSMDSVLISRKTRIASRSYWSHSLKSVKRKLRRAWILGKFFPWNFFHDPLRFRNLSKVFLRCSSSGNWKKALSRVRYGMWSNRECCICWQFSCHIPFSIIEFPFHLEKNLNFQRYNFLIGIQDVCRILRIYLNSKRNFITSLRLLF